MDSDKHLEIYIECNVHLQQPSFGGWSDSRWSPELIKLSSCGAHPERTDWGQQTQNPSESKVIYLQWNG